MKHNQTQAALVARRRQRRALARAALALLPDYAPGGELTIWTALDGADWPCDDAGELEDIPHENRHPVGHSR